MSDKNIISGDVADILNQKQQRINIAREGQQSVIQTYCAQNDIDPNKVTNFKQTPNGNYHLVLDDDDESSEDE